MRLCVFGRPCSDLLSQVLRLSTIGAEGFDGRVRDGIGSWAPRKNHKVSEKHTCEDWFCFDLVDFQVIWEAPGGVLATTPALVRRPAGGALHRQAREKQTTQVVCGHRLMRTIKPIELLVPVSFTHCCASTPGLSTWWSSTALIGNTRFEGGFLLRCFQQLSRPNLATLQCGWRHNRSTRGSSIPVLSY